MKNLYRYKKSVAGGIIILFILLFTYAAVVKILDFERFSRQLSQSPLWPAAIGRVLAWIVPGVEIGTVYLLILYKNKLRGLYASTVLMLLFTLYIIYILRFSGYVPCACGGVIEHLGWRQHLWFNLGFVILGVLGIGLSHSLKRDHMK